MGPFLGVSVAVEDPGESQGRHRHEGVGLGDVDALAPSRLVSVAEGGEYGEGAEEAGDRVAGKQRLGGAMGAECALAFCRLLVYNGI